MTGRIAFFSAGLFRLRDEIRLMSGLEPQFTLASARGSSAVAGWGHKPTAARARAAAARARLPYLAFEDGFLRSLKPGPAQRPMSMVMDRAGIYYDARQPSDLEAMLEGAEFTPGEVAMARDVIAAIAARRLSKYNHGSDSLGGLSLPRGKPVVILVDQTAGDESIAGGLAHQSSFERMAEAALRDNPGAAVIAKLHPEALLGTKSGYLLGLARRHGMQILDHHVSPWCLFGLEPRVYTVSSQFGFEALLAGCRVTCFGVPFYAGWGLTDDRVPLPPRRGRTRRIEELAAAVYLRYCRYFDAWRRTPVDAMTAIDQLGFLRRSFLANSRPVIGYRIARWKRRAVSVLLDGPHGAPRFTGNLPAAIARAKASQAAIAAWGAEAINLRPRIERQGLECLAVEDGFLRSVGLGAAFVQPLSLVFDGRGLYFDSTRASDIEHMLAHGEIAPEDLARAKIIREQIIAANITKYNVQGGGEAAPAIPPGSPVVLVPGQVSDDAAVLIGRTPGFPAGRNVNALLLERAAAANPGAFVIFKPHPDVEHLGRAGALTEADERRHAGHVARRTPLELLLPLATRIETYSSLAGFEALLREIPVTVHGLPFYAGWGLTSDHFNSPRRGRHRSLDELAAAALILYPRYWDPVSGLACPPEVALQRITEARAAGAGPWRGLRLIMGRGAIMLKRAGRKLAGRRNDPQ